MTIYDHMFIMTLYSMYQISMRDHQNNEKVVKNWWSVIKNMSKWYTLYTLNKYGIVQKQFYAILKMTAAKYRFKVSYFMT